VRFPKALKVVELFRKHGNLALIRDGKFLVGGFDGEKAVGERIDVLPNGVKLNKGFPLFGRSLTIHDERSRGHWDVIFENPSGSFSYVYSLEKMRMSREKKYKLVDDFERCLPRLRRGLTGALGESDLILAMLVLLKTKMRVGGEIYYKRSRHKGLTTLKKKDVRIVGDKVVFDFVGKDGVPQRLQERFSDKVLVELKRVLEKRRRNDFVFLNNEGRVFRDTDFETCFERFCGEKFYPHIVRSHFATREVERFLAKDRENARKFCLGIAAKLGHKKLIKGKWEDSYEVTLHHYVRGDLVEKIGAMI